MTGHELIASIERERARLDALVAGLDASQLTEPTLGDGWSVKDLLAHIAGWERRLTTWLEAMQRGETPVRPEPGYTFDDIDKLNARDFEESRPRPLAQVLAEARAVHADALAAVRRLTDADLLDESRFGWPVWRMIRGNTDEHYREHAAQIESSLGEDTSEI